MKTPTTFFSSFLKSKSSITAKWVSLFLCSLIISESSFSQKTNLIISGTSPKLFITHKVTAKENFYSIARTYNVPPKEIASYNNLQFEKGLDVGESIKIPLSEANFAQAGGEQNGMELIPVYHAVQPKEGLYRVSINYNKVPIASIKRWNHLQADIVSAGTPLIVGYLKVSATESPLATNRLASPNAQIAVIPSVEKPATVIEDVKPQQTVINPQPVKEENKPARQTDELKETATTVNTRSNVNFAGGYFKKLYDDQATAKTPVTESGSAGTFKSTSGWQDGKYYCFNNDAPPGSIIKITSYAAGKSVYAKVLDAIPDIRQNSGLSIIISNAAVEELGINDDKFSCGLSYVK